MERQRSPQDTREYWEDVLEDRAYVWWLYATVGLAMPIGWTAVYGLLGLMQRRTGAIGVWSVGVFAGLWLTGCAAWLITGKRLRLTYAARNWTWWALGKETLWAIAWGGGTLLGCVLLAWLMQSILGIEHRDSAIVETARRAPNSPLLLLLLLLGMTAIPVAEELFYRGYLYNVLKIRVHRVVAAAVAALLFVIPHRYDLVGSATIFLVGLAFVAAYEHRKTLVTPVLVHILGNVVMMSGYAVGIAFNLYRPAATWEEARQRPAWLTDEVIAAAPDFETAEDLRQYAIDTWGSRGSRRWKREVAVFEAVCARFPEDEQTCAKARLGIVTVYYSYLADYRRAATEADRMVDAYGQYHQEAAEALMWKARACYALGEFALSRAAFEQVLEDYADVGWEQWSPRDWLDWLDRLGK